MDVPRHPPTADAGFSIVATMLSLLVSAILVALVLTSTLGSHGQSKPGIANAPGVGLADNVQAQQALSISVTAATTAEAASGGDYSTVTVSILSAANPSITYMDGPSTSSSVISVANSASGGGITMVVRASSGICWLVWAGSGGTWYGAQTNQTSCTAPPLNSAPTASAVSSTAIGWRHGGFPGA